MSVPTVEGVCPLCGPHFSRATVAHGPDFEYRTTRNEEFRFVRCEECGVVVLDPRPVDDAIAALYPADYEPYRFEQLPAPIRAARNIVQRRKVDLIARYAPKGGLVVDVGCGGGALLRLIQACTSDDFDLVGWDYPGPHLDRLAESGVKVVAAPIEAAYVPSGAHVFVLNQVLEHFAHPDRMLRMLASALRPGGHLIIETPDTDGSDARWFSKRYWGGYHTPRHMVLFNQKNLCALVERCGLRVVETAHLASPAFWIQSLHHSALESRLPSLASFFTLRNVPLVGLFSAFDLVRRTTSNQRVIAVRPA